MDKIAVSTRLATVQSDSETSLWFYRARYYNPQLQRFISEDPIGYGGGNSNLYAYVFNAPTKLIDPFGLEGADPRLVGLVGHLQNILPSATLQTDANGNPVALVIPENSDAVGRTLENQGYDTGIFPPFWNPIDHWGGSEYRTGVNTIGFHFRKQYHTCLPPADTCIDPRQWLAGRKTVLDQFHIDPKNPLVDPIGHEVDFLKDHGIDPYPSCGDPGLGCNSPLFPFSRPW